MQVFDLDKLENGAISEAINALEYLASNERPEGGEQFPNSECCYMIADELKRLCRRYKGTRVAVE
jgi:hypothetical protein